MIDPGRTFGRWVVVGPALSKIRSDGRNRGMHVVRCACGTERDVPTTDLTSNKSRSCGCLKREMTSKRHTTHGATRGRQTTSEYRAWVNMLARCRYPHHHKNHAGRGITVCDRWRDSFETFLEDLGPRPTKKHTVERIDNSKGYEIENCRWATRQEQGRNKRNNLLLTLHGETLCLQAWSDRLEIHRTTLADRLRRGWSIERTLTEPVQRRVWP